MNVSISKSSKTLCYKCESSQHDGGLQQPQGRNEEACHIEYGTKKKIWRPSSFLCFEIIGASSTTFYWIFSTYGKWRGDRVWESI